MTINDKYSMENMLAQLIFKYACGKVLIDEAKQIASNRIDAFKENCKTSSSLAHKGLDYYAREIVRIM